MEKVKVRECACPGHPHNGEGDWIALAPTLSLEGGLAAEFAMRDVSSIADPVERSDELQRRWVLIFVRHGAKAWNFLDENGEEVPFDIEAILDDYSIARPVAEKGADLYSDAVLRPFLERQRKRSPTGPTEATTSKARRRTRLQCVPSSPGTTAASVP